MRDNRYFIWHKDTPFRAVRLWLLGTSLFTGITFIIFLTLGLATDNQLLGHMAMIAAAIEILIGIITLTVMRQSQEGSH